MSEWERIQRKIHDGEFGISLLEFRRRAIKSIVARRFGDGYGVSSSDVNHAMFVEATLVERFGGAPFAEYADQVRRPTIEGAR